MPLAEGEKSLMKCAFVQIQHQSMMDGQTDLLKQTSHFACISMLTRGKTERTFVAFQQKYE